MKTILKRMTAYLTILSLFILLLPTNISNAAWFDNSWDYRVQLSTDISQIPGDSTNIPLYVDLSLLPVDFFTNVRSDGADIRVTDNDQVTELNFELVSINTTSMTGELHVLVPNLSGTISQDLYIYYGNSTATSSSTPNVWTDYRGVWHLDEPKSTSGGGGGSNTNIAIATQQAMDGGDGSWANLFGSTPVTSQIDLTADEDQIGDGERAHTTEEVAFISFATNAAADILDENDAIIGEIGIINSLSSTPQSTNFRNTYTSPIIIATPVLEDTSTNPGIVRIDTFNTTSFSPYIQNPGDVVAPDARSIHYMIIEAGSHTLPGGTKLEAQKVATTTDPNENGDWSIGKMIQINPTNTYSNPLVLGQVMTNNDPLWQVFWTSNGSQTNPPNSSNIYIGRHAGEDPVLTRLNEDLGYLIIEDSSGNTNGFDWLADKTSDSIRGVDNSPPFSVPAVPSNLPGPFKDSTINSFNADFTGNITAQETGQIGNAVDLSGDTNSKLDIGGLNYNSQNSLNQLTASFWLKTTDTDRSGILDFDRSEHWQLGLNFHNAGGQQGQVSFDTANQTDGIRDLNSGTTVNNDQWRFVTAVFDKDDPNDKKIYIDGVLAAQAAQHSNNGLGKNTTRYGFIGDGSEANQVGGNTNNLPYEGLIDEVRIKHSADSADTILTTYNNQNNNASFWTISPQEANNTAPSKPTDIFVNTTNAQLGQENPFDLTIGGTASHQIFFSAVYQDDDSGDEAVAAQIQVSTDPTFSSVTHWDSDLTTIADLTESNRTPDIEYNNFGDAATLGLAMDDGNIVYYWRIRFQDVSGSIGEYSDIKMFTLLDIPNQPTSVSANKIDGSPDTFDVLWQDTSVNEENFEIQGRENTGGGFGAYADLANSPVLANVTTVNDSNTVGNAAYMYRVRACNYAGCSPYTEDPSDHFTDPLSPINVYGDYDSDTQFTVNFTDRSVVNILDVESCIGTANCNAETYSIEQAGINTVTGVPDTIIDNTGVVANQTFRWRSRVNNGATSEYTYSPYEYTTPAAPSLLSANYVTDSLIVVEWQDNSAFEDGFRIEISEDGGPFQELTPGLNTTGSNITSYIFTQGAPDKTYNFRITAHIQDTLFNSELFSTQVTTGDVFSSPDAPTNLQAEYILDNQIELTWQDNSAFEDNYNVYVSENGGPFTLDTTLAADSVSYTYTSGTSDNTYEFQVEAIINANLPNNPNDLTAQSNITDPTNTSPATPALTPVSASNSTIDWQITDNSSIENGFIIYDSDGITELARLNASNLTQWTESGLSPNVQVDRFIAAFVNNPGSTEVISTLSPIATGFTLANAPEDIQAPYTFGEITITWTDGENPIGTEFQAENLTTGQISGWSTDLQFSYSPQPNCGTFHEILLKSRNQNNDETFAEIVLVEAPNCTSSGSSSSGGGSSPSNPFISQPISSQAVSNKCQLPKDRFIGYQIPELSTIQTNETNYIFQKNTQQIIFPDFTLQQWGAQYLQTGIENNIINGYQDGLMRPNQKVTNGEFAKLLANTLQLDINTNDSGHWSKPFMDALIQFGLEIDTNPNQVLTRKQVIDLTVKAYDLIPEVSSSITYADLPDDINYQQSFINPLTNLGVLKGYQELNSKPLLKLDQQVTRIEALKIILLTNNKCQ